MGCCTSDPSQDRPGVRDTEQREGMPQQETNNTVSRKQAGTREQVPDESKSTLNVPNDKEQEESLLVPSTLSAVDDIHDPPPPSDYEDNADSYALDPHERVNKNNNNNDSDENAADAQDKNENTAVNANGSNDNNENDKAKAEEVVDAQQKQASSAPPDEEQQDEQQQKKQNAKPSQKEILENEELKQRSLRLVNDDKQEFIKFLQKILRSKLKHKIWAKCDPDGVGRIETDRFMYFWTLPVMLYKRAVHQKVHGKDAAKPTIDQEELKMDFKHLVTWVIRRFGEKQSDGTWTIVLKKENFDTLVVEYVEAYAKASGELYEDY